MGEQSGTSPGRAIRGRGRKAKLPVTNGRGKGPSMAPPRSNGSQLFLFPELTAEDRMRFAAFIEWVGAVDRDSGEARLSIDYLLPADTEAIKWLNCGVVWDGTVISFNGPEGPGRPSEGTMLDVLEAGDVPPSYFLSPNAATGMLRRADKMQRKFLPALRRGLEALKAQGEKSGGGHRPTEGKPCG